VFVGKSGNGVLIQAICPCPGKYAKNLLYGNAYAGNTTSKNSGIWLGIWTRFTLASRLEEGVRAGPYRLGWV
jgi:hypothetical protein